MSTKDRVNTPFVKLSDEQIGEKVAFFNRYVQSMNAASGSAVDANANVSCKNVASLSAELYKDFSIQLSRRLITDELTTRFGSETASAYLQDLNHRSIYTHDESHTFLPYCASVSLYPFLREGLTRLGGESEAPQHLSSFCGGVVNLVFALSSQFAGAIATVEFLMMFDYFARKDFGDDYLYTDREVIENHLQHVVYALNQPAAARNYQSVFWNVSVFDRYYFESLFGEFVFPDFSKPKWESLSRLQAFFLDWFRKERHERNAVLTFPVVTAAMLTSEGVVKDREFLSVCSRQFSLGNSFFVYMSNSADSLASCCRLRNELIDNTFSFSLGAGGVQTGSAQVITLNINRIIQDAVAEQLGHPSSTPVALESIDEGRLFEHLGAQVKRVHQYLVAFRAFYEGLEQKGLLPAYSAGFISFKKQFLTLGVNGVLESAEFLGLEPTRNERYTRYLQTLLQTIFDLNKEAKARYGVLFNTEFVPAENLGVKNAEWDRAQGYYVPRSCYNSYMYRVEDTGLNLVDKFLLHGREIIQYLDGGSALHLNLGEFPSEASIVRLFDLAARSGCNYWTWNVPSTFCEDCRNLDKDTRERCPACGSGNLTYLTRVIGYLKKIRDFSQARQIEAARRFYHAPETDRPKLRALVGEEFSQERRVPEGREASA